MISQSEEPGKVSLQRISLLGAKAPLIAVSEKLGLKKNKKIKIIKINQLTTRLWGRHLFKLCLCRGTNADSCLAEI